MSNITSPFIRTLSFHIRLRNPKSILGSGHREFAEILGRKNLRKNLTLVDFGYESDYDVEEVGGYFRAIYGDHVEPGVLRVRRVEREMHET